LLEIAALLTFGFWGWGLAEGTFKFIFTLVTPLLAAVFWGIFNVPGDPNRSGKAPIPVPGLIRLGLEFIFFGLAAWMLFIMGAETLTWVYSTIVIIHYGVSYDRIRWLLGKH